METKDLNKKLKQIAQTAKEQFNINMFFVGGCVRDELLNVPCDDIDIAVENGTFEQLKSVISQFTSDFTEEPVGNTFAVIKANIDGFELDFALCRTERSSGSLHQDFDISLNATIEEDLARRDIRINAIAKNVMTGDILDPFNGIGNLLDKIADYCTLAFAEDPLRVLRVARFIARFDLTPTQRLVDLCRTLSPKDISAERFGGELWKMAKQAKTPSKFFNFLRTVGWLSQVFPELENLFGIPQSAKWHPEGCAYTHTMHCIDATTDPFYRMVLMCHDLGKATTTALNKRGDWSAYGHEFASVGLSKKMLGRVKLESAEGFGGSKSIDRLLILVEKHMVGHTANMKDHKLIKLVRDLHKLGLDFQDLVNVCIADSSGRPPLPTGITPTLIKLQERVDAFEERGIFTPIVTGKKLLEVGVKQGVEMGKLIQKAQGMQDTGKLTEENWKILLKV